MAKKPMTNKQKFFAVKGLSIKVKKLESRIAYLEDDLMGDYPTSTEYSSLGINETSGILKKLAANSILSREQLTPDSKTLVVCFDGVLHTVTMSDTLYSKITK